MRWDKCRFDAVLFDFDGTLADTRKDVWASVQYAAGTLGATLPQQFVQQPANLALPLQQIFAQLSPQPPQTKLTDFKQQIEQHYRGINTLQNTNLYPGIQTLLKQIQKDGLPCYIVSMKEHQALYRVLQLKGWDMYFDGHFSPDTFPDKQHTKAELIGDLLTRLQKSRPVYIGDSVGDVEAAQSNGITSVAVTYGDGDVAKLLRAKPDYVADNAQELAQILYSTN